MFRIECFCDDKYLAKTLWALQAVGGVYNLTSTPVVNVQKRDGVLRQRVPNGTRIETLRLWLTKRKLRIVTPGDIRSFAKEHNLSTTSYSNILRIAQDEGLLKRVPGEFRYRVLLKPVKLVKKKPKRKVKKAKLKVVTQKQEVA
jgi:hypothetical protein